MKEVYYIVVIGNFEREPIEFAEYPTEEQIAEAIVSQNGVSARVEKRYKIQ